MAEPHVASPLIDQVLSDPEFQRLTRRKASLSLLLTVVTMVCYFSFVLLLAGQMPLLSKPFMGATIGIPLGVCLIFLGWVVTGIYARWANDAYDKAVVELRARYFAGRTEA